MTTRVLGVIPARLASVRLPRKPLHSIAGRPLIEWVWRRAVEAGVFDDIVIATDSPEVQAAARGFGASAVLTRAEHPSGTDRVAEVVRRAEWRDFGVIVNVQGDEPFVRRDHLEAAVALVRDGGWDVGTVATPIASAAEWREPAVVKAVRGDDGRALFFTRAPVPHPRDAEPDFAGGAFLRHVGIYSYTRDALLRWVALPESPLERIEKLEQLRALAAGLRIGIAVGAPAEGGVDTPADAARAETILLKQMATPALERA
ncbi:3-deoxy-manno-octulosonate cytidylyltransferase [Longimicrobium sp.]|uniref:3-deoxy-manno-octulosonate cytidylyltransferase n=1 Tax=Longimicrobium sp. TaxID=2029185 RepID=UPI002BEB10FC|nr:3-deoxy-manno-octulosonate cytidylyltransferase [Longimicrobium sp.]HSU18029.1 3-deoxy-manno-octulosonate cytidylyltransferase [Longimicrobium sp.]